MVLLPSTSRHSYSHIYPKLSTDTLNSSSIFMHLCEEVRRIRGTRQVTGVYPPRVMPNFFIRYWRVVRFVPSRAAAPVEPPTAQCVSLRVRKMYSRSASASVMQLSAEMTAGGLLRSDN